MKSPLRLVLCLVLVGAASTALAELAPWTAHSAIKVRPLDPPGSAEPPQLFAARNEWEAVQVIVRDDGGAALAGCTVEVSPLAGPGAPIDRIDLYREHYVWVEHPSRKPAGPETKGYWPDALIPFVDTHVGEPRAGAPFDVPEGWNQPIWIDLFVPDDQEPGDYEGAIEVSCAGAGTISIPLLLTVWDFAIPDKITLPSSYGYSCRTVYNKHQAMGGVVGREELTQMYYREALRHRIMFNSGHCVEPEWYWDPDTQEGWFDMTAMDEQVGPAFDGTLEGGASIDTYRMPYPPGGATREEQLAFWRALAQAFRDRGWFEKMYLYLPDEPTPDEYPHLVDLANLLHEADPELRAMATEQIAEGLIGAVDIWCPDEPLFSDSLPGPPHPQDYPPRQALGEEVWWYNCMSAQFIHDFSNHFVDDQGMYLRIWPWLTRRYGFTGILYWETVYLYGQVEDPWEDQYATQFFCNGDGNLFYPGVPAKIGGTTDIPVASIRLKELREGMEDYEYFAILDGMGEGDFVQAEVERRAFRTFQWEHDPALIEESRARLAAMILGTLDTVPPTAPTGLAASTGDGWIALAWDAVPDEDLAGYEVSLSRYSSERVIVRTVGSGETETTFAGLENTKPYYLAVRAFDRAGNRGPWSDEIRAAPGPPAGDDDAGDDTGDDDADDQDDDDDDGSGSCG